MNHAVDALATRVCIDRPANPVRVAASPASHPFVRHSLAGPNITLLPDPVLPGTPVGQWWPPAVVDPVWVHRNADVFDLLHVHFGLESFTAGHLRAVVEALAAEGKPLVFTLHDLDNPQLTDQSHHRTQLDIMVAAADELITLTPGAADAISRRWGRTATVIEHPFLAQTAAFGHAASESAPAAAPGTPNSTPPRGTLVSMHLRDLRPNIEGVAATRALLTAADTLRTTVPDLRVELRVNDTVRDPAALAAIEQRVAADPRAELVRHPRLSDSELEWSLDDTDVSVMPYRHGTHSGWLELCWDLGVPVAAPSIGFYAEQHRGSSGVASFEWSDPASLASALERLLADNAPRNNRTALQAERRRWRREQQTRIQAQHALVYRRALARVSRGVELPTGRS